MEAMGHEAVPQIKTQSLLKRRFFGSASTRDEVTDQLAATTPLDMRSGIDVAARFPGWYWPLRPAFVGD